MRKVISISETLRAPDKDHPHVQACADAEYDEEAGTLIVQLKLGNADAKPEVVRTQVALEEALPAAKEIFRGWVKRLVEAEALPVEE